MACSKDVPPLNMKGDVFKNWKQWRSKFEAYMEENDMKSHPEQIQCAQLLISIGEEALQVYRSFDFAEDEEGKLQVLLDKFEGHFAPKQNLTYQRLKFINFKQRPGDDFMTFVNRLRHEARLCEWGEMTDELTRIVIIAGVGDDLLRKRLMQNDGQTLQETIDYCLLAEDVKKTMSGQAKGDGKGPAKGEGKGPPKGGQSSSCTFCGTRHERGNCPAYKKTCPICKRQNHFAKMCRFKKDGNNSQ